MTNNLIKGNRFHNVLSLSGFVHKSNGVKWRISEFSAQEDHRKKDNHITLIKSFQSDYFTYFWILGINGNLHGM